MVTFNVLIGRTKRYTLSFMTALILKHIALMNLKGRIEHVVAYLDGGSNDYNRIICIGWHVFTISMHANDGSV